MGDRAVYYYYKHLRLLGGGLEVREAEGETIGKIECAVIVGKLERFPTRKGDGVVINDDPHAFWWAFRNFWGRDVTITISQNVTTNTAGDEPKRRSEP